MILYLSFSTSTVRPQVSIALPDLMVVLGDEASFECQASGDPAPELLWRRLFDNSALPVQQSSSGDNRSTFKVLVTHVLSFFLLLIIKYIFDAVD